MYIVHGSVQRGGFLQDGVTCCPDAAVVHASVCRKRGVPPGWAAARGLGSASPLVICVVTPLFCWSYAGQSWKQCPSGHFLYGDFREKQNWKTSSNIQVVLFFSFSLFLFPLWGALEKPTEDDRDPNEWRARLWVRVELFSTQIRSALCEIWAVTGEMHLTFPGGLFGGWGMGETLSSRLTPGKVLWNPAEPEEWC